MSKEDPGGYEKLTAILNEIKSGMIALDQPELADDISYAQGQLLGSGTEFIYASKEVLASIMASNLKLPDELKETILECQKGIEEGIHFSDGFRSYLYSLWQRLTGF